MKEFLEVQGSWRQRMGIYLLTAFLTLLVIWLIGFILDDIRSFPKPKLHEIEQQFIDNKLLKQKSSLQRNISTKNQLVNDLMEQRRRLQQSTNNLQTTIRQLHEQQRLRLQHGQELSVAEKNTQARSLEQFLLNQRHDQELTQTIMKLTNERQALSDQLKRVDKKINIQRKPAYELYREQLRKQRILEASAQLLILFGLLGGTYYLLMRHKKTKYKLLYLASIIAIIYHSVDVVHDYFPTQLFKYMMIAVLIFLFGRLLIYFINRASSTQLGVLLKRYRDAYIYFLCPICEYPIRRGPMQFKFWTAKTLASQTAQMQGDSSNDPYTCPACSTQLFESCTKCGNSRYSLLPSCQHCGDKIKIAKN